MSPDDSFLRLYAVGFFARLSYALARNPALSLFALYFGAGPEAIGWMVGISTVTGIFFKLPAGALSDVIGSRTDHVPGAGCIRRDAVHLSPGARMYSSCLVIRFAARLCDGQYTVPFPWR